MPRAKDNRKPVGTGVCEKCGEETAEFFQVQKGKKLGRLYRKCLNCPTNQHPTAQVEQGWLDGMTKTPHPMIPHPFTKAPEPKGEESGEEPSEPESKTPAEPQETQGGSGETETKKTGLIGLGLLIAAGAVAILT